MLTENQSTSNAGGRPTGYAAASADTTANATSGPLVTECASQAATEEVLEVKDNAGAKKAFDKRKNGATVEFIDRNNNMVSPPTPPPFGNGGVATNLAWRKWWDQADTKAWVAGIGSPLRARVSGGDAPAPPPPKWEPIITSKNSDVPISELRIGAAAIDVLDLKDESAPERIKRLNDEVDKRSGSDVIMLPEYFFTHNSDQLGNLDGKKGALHYSPDEYKQVEQAADALAKKHPDKLILTGTVLHKTEDGSMKNTLLICNEGKVLRYDKAQPTDGEDAYAKSKGSTINGKPMEPFKYKGLTCVAEICNDNADKDRNKQSADLHLVTTFGGGAVTSKAHKGGVSVESDGGGTAKMRKESGKDTYDIVNRAPSIKTPNGATNEESTKFTVKPGPPGQV